MFIGRMSPDKGAHHAVRVAWQAGWPLVIRAKIGEPAERAYFDQRVRPLLGPDDDMLAEQPRAARIGLMRPAAALVNPITWPEPFGLVMARALAAATPVLTFPNGAAPEIIDHGRTGYLCRGENEMIIAVARVHRISRWQCRAAAERRFSLARMVADYERRTGPSWKIPAGRRPNGRERAHVDRIRGPGTITEMLFIPNVPAWRFPASALRSRRRAPSAGYGTGPHGQPLTTGPYLEPGRQRVD